MTVINKQRILITIIITSILSFNLWMLLPFQIFYKGLAIVFVLSAILIRADSVKHSPYRYLCDLWLWLTINNLIDEFFFDPRKVGLNEYLFAAAVVIHAIIKIKKNGKVKSGAY